MLVLTRRLNESIIIGDNIEIKILQVRGTGDQAVIRIGISAPKDVTLLRKEVYDEVVSANQQAVDVRVQLPKELMDVINESGNRPASPARTDKKE